MTGYIRSALIWVAGTPDKVASKENDVRAESVSTVDGASRETNSRHRASSSQDINASSSFRPAPKRTSPTSSRSYANAVGGPSTGKLSSSRDSASNDQMKGVDSKTTTALANEECKITQYEEELERLRNENLKIRRDRQELALKFRNLERSLDVERMDAHLLRQKLDAEVLEQEKRKANKDQMAQDSIIADPDGINSLMNALEDVNRSMTETALTAIRALNSVDWLSPVEFTPYLRVSPVEIGVISKHLTRSEISDVELVAGDLLTTLISHCVHKGFFRTFHPGLAPEYDKLLVILFDTLVVHRPTTARFWKMLTWESIKSNPLFSQQEMRQTASNYLISKSVELIRAATVENEQLYPQLVSVQEALRTGLDHAIDLTFTLLELHAQYAATDLQVLGADLIGQEFDAAYMVDGDGNDPKESRKVSSPRRIIGIMKFGLIRVSTDPISGDRQQISEIKAEVLTTDYSP